MSNPGRRLARTLMLLTLGAGLSGFGRCGGTDPAWRLAWSDEFEGGLGDSPDPARWRFDVGTGPSADGWGNQQQEYDTARPQNVSLDGDGHLVITARQESYLGSAYTSGRIKTQGLYQPRFGRIEARMKMPTGQGLWPAFWLLGGSFEATGWPACGEIDVMEYRGDRPRRITGALHGPGYSGSNPLIATYDLPGGAGFDQDFHVFAIEWEPELIAWEVDGQVWQVATPQRLPPGTSWAFDQPFFLLLNLAVGGGYAGAVDGSAVFPQQLVVDYVRVYARTN